jgi:hypothetical protein
MSIYGSCIVLDCRHEDGCGKWVRDDDGELWDIDDTRPCTCGLPDAPFVYQGSHRLPAETDPKGGYLDLAVIPDHITRDGHPEGQEGQRKSFVRLSVMNPPSDEIYRGRPYIEGGHSVIVLHRRHIKRLHEFLGDWLVAEDVA